MMVPKVFEPLKFDYCCGKQSILSITKTGLFKYIKLLQPKKNQIKNSAIFIVFALNIDCGYSLEPPRRGGSNGYPPSVFSKRSKIMYNPVNPNFTI